MKGLPALLVLRLAARDRSCSSGQRHRTTRVSTPAPGPRRSPGSNHLAKRIRESARAAFADLSKTVPGLALSIGIADLHTSGATTGDLLVRAADKALYHVKAMGKDAISARTEPVQAA